MEKVSSQMSRQLKSTKCYKPPLAALSSMRSHHHAPYLTEVPEVVPANRQGIGSTNNLATFWCDKKIYIYCVFTPN